MSNLAPGLYAIGWKRRTQTPMWRPELLEWDGSRWNYPDGQPCTIARGPDWIGPKIDLPTPGDAA